MKSKGKKRYNDFFNSMKKASDDIDLIKSIKSTRKGTSNIRDKIVFYKSAFSVAETWAGFPRAIVYWLALTPLAIDSCNKLFLMVGMGFKIPLDYGSVIAVGFVSSLMVFGYLAFAKFGLNRRANEISGLQHPGTYALYSETIETQERVNEIKKEIRELKEIVLEGKKND